MTVGGSLCADPKRVLLVTSGDGMHGRECGYAAVLSQSCCDRLEDVRGERNEVRIGGEAYLV